MTKSTYCQYSPEFKREAVRLAEQSEGTISQFARELGVRVNQIYKWRRQIQEKQDDAFPGSGDGSVLAAHRRLGNGQMP